MSFKNFFSGLGIIIAATIGAGLFTLPIIFKQAGWGTTTAYLVVFSGVLTYAHSLYWRTRVAEKTDLSLLGLVRKEFGPRTQKVAFLAIVGGLILTLVIYLILGAKFLGLLFPLEGWPAFIFWILASLPLLFSIKRFAELENLGTVLKAGIIIIIFFAALNPGALFSTPSFEAGKAFLPFGAILFALAGWTAIEPAMAAAGEEKFGTKTKWLLVLGTVISATLYLFFVMSIFGSANSITPDTISGLAGWPVWRRWAILALGIFATWTAYLSISLEAKNSLGKGSNWKDSSAVAAVVFGPLLLLWAGLDNLMGAIGLTGGLFLSVQYIFIILLAKKKLKLCGFEDFASAFLVAVFLVGALYEIYYFAVK